MQKWGLLRCSCIIGPRFSHSPVTLNTICKCHFRNIHNKNISSVIIMKHAVKWIFLFFILCKIHEKVENRCLFSLHLSKKKCNQTKEKPRLSLGSYNIIETRNLIRKSTTKYIIYVRNWVGNCWSSSWVVNVRKKLNSKWNRRFIIIILRYKIVYNVLFNLDILCIRNTMKILKKLFDLK